LARAVLSTVHILTQILTAWLVTTLKMKHSEQYGLFLNPLRFQVKGSQLDTIRCRDDGRCGPEL
jgi:hypothetical protein